LNDEILKINNLSIHYPTFEGVVKAVDKVDFVIPRGEVVGLVGESGCGKSTLGLSILRLIRPPGEIAGGKIVFNNENLLVKSKKDIRQLRGSKISMVFQDPMMSLNPLFHIERHFLETMKSHNKDFNKKEAMEKVEGLVEYLGISPSRLYDYPHQLSGGMRQRVMIGLGLILEPELIIADEPTNSLDVIVEAHFLDLLKELKEEYNLTILLITHNMGIVAELADRVAVMYAGRIVEEAQTTMLYDNPLHPYTEGLLKSIPNIDAKIKTVSCMPGSPPNLMSPPTGCSFHPRCPKVMDICKKREPENIVVNGGSKNGGRSVECFLYGEKSDG
jgi:peptide/nickel transport system ATP-binding protein